MTTMQEAYEEAILRQDKYHLNTECDYVLSKEYFKAGWEVAGKECAAVRHCIDDMGRELDSNQAEIYELKRQASRFSEALYEHTPLTESQRRHFWDVVEAED